MTAEEACCTRICSASKAANSSAPASALPGRQEAKMTSAMQIQPRPLIMPMSKASNTEMGRKAPPTAMKAPPRRSQERRGGEEGGGKGTLRGGPYHEKKKK